MKGLGLGKGVFIWRWGCLHQFTLAGWFAWL